MKTSTFLTKVLKSFHNGKSYCRFGTEGYSFYKNRNLNEAISFFSDKIGFPKQKANFAIAKSLGHTSVDKFGSSKNVTFSQVAPVLKAAIKRERASGN